MKEKEIIEGNKLIAEFMGVKYYQSQEITADLVKYHSSWDWQVSAMAKAFHECRGILTRDTKDIYRENIRTLSDEWMKAALNNQLILGFGWLVYCIKLIHEYNSQPNQQTPKADKQ
jgi:hypothetical protein